MSVSGYDLEELMSVYADWVGWLKEKRASLENQLAKLQAKQNPEPDAGAHSASAAAGNQEEGETALENPGETPDALEVQAVKTVETGAPDRDEDELDDWL